MILSTSRHNIDAQELRGLARPFSCELDSKSGGLWVAEFDACTLRCHDLEKHSVLKTSHGRDLKGAHSVFWNAQNELVVVDYKAVSVEVFSAEGDYLYTLADQGTGLMGPAAGKFFDRKGELEIWIADYGAHQARVFSPLGQALRSFPSSPRASSEPGSFDRLHDFCFLDDSVVVVDTWNKRLQRFSFEGKFIEIIDHPFELPVSISRYGDLIAVSDVGSHCIKLFKGEFCLLNTIGTQGELLKPYEVRLSQELCFICDSDHGRILYFPLESATVE